LLNLQHIPIDQFKQCRIVGKIQRPGNDDEGEINIRRRPGGQR